MMDKPGLLCPHVGEAESQADYTSLSISLEG